LQQIATTLGHELLELVDRPQTKIAKQQRAVSGEALFDKLPIILRAGRQIYPTAGIRASGKCFPGSKGSVRTSSFGDRLIRFRFIDPGIADFLSGRFVMVPLAFHQVAELRRARPATPAVRRPPPRPPLRSGASSIAK
jgi:hypothetical protein